MALIYDQQYNKVDDGVWAEFEGSKFLIVHTGNIKFQRAMARLQAPHRRKIEKNQMDPGEMKTLLCRAMAEALVLDWKEVKGKNGQDAAFSKENVETALKHNDSFREFVMEFSGDLNNFREEEVKELGEA